MGWYAWTLAGSNFFAPIICGFINDAMGYHWVFYFPTIFCAVTWVFLFFFMEETNYDRATVGIVATSPSNEPVIASHGEKEKGAEEGSNPTSPVDVPDHSSGTAKAPKSFWKRMAILDKPRPFMMHYRAWQSLELLSWPVVFYSGFSYGTYLVYFNILNATSSIILGGAPYNFSPAMVGLSYLSCMVGVTAG